MKEREFADRIGVARETLRKVRKQHLDPETDFKKSGQDVVLTEEGQRRAAAVLAENASAEK